jgi:hypothetical protein
MAGMTREGVVAIAKKVGAKHRGMLTPRDLEIEGGVPAKLVYQLFPGGGFTEVRRRAGMRPGIHARRVTEAAALEEYDRVAQRLGGVPSWNLFRSHGRFGPQVLISRFGGKRGLVKAYRRWLRARGRNWPRRDLSRWNRRLGRGGTLTRSEETSFGPVLDFGGLLHEPTSEAGVVFLFGAMARELGYLVDGFRPTFPDCEAKRLTKGPEPRWARVLIEFEFRSSNFESHGHDPRGCDLIVCWEHDWAECPVEVVELRREVERVRGGVRGLDSHGGQGVPAQARSCWRVSGAPHSGQAVEAQPRRL